MNQITKVAVVFAALSCAPFANATPIEPTGIIGSFCASGGSYNAETLELRLQYFPDGCGVYVGPFDDWPTSAPVFADESTMSVNALVDNDGNTLGGEFAWLGAIPELGIADVSLLASGEVIDVGALITPGSDHVEALQVQIEFTAFAAELISFGLDDLGLGPFGTLWLTALSGWGEVPPWSTSEILPSPTLNELFTYQTRPGLTVPEPGTLALLGIGLFGMALTRRSNKA